MDPHATWFDFIPGYQGFKETLQPSLSRTWVWQVFQTTNFDLVHVMSALVVLLFLAFGAIRPTPWVHKNKIKIRQVTTLGLSFDHQKETVNAAINLPIALDPSLISRTTLRDHSLRTWNTIDQSGIDRAGGDGAAPQIQRSALLDDTVHIAHIPPQPAVDQDKTQVIPPR